jgi:hypothetical protein
MVELVRLYSNLSYDEARFCDVTVAASTRRQSQSAARPRQQQHRLNMDEATELVAAHHRKESITQLAQRYKVHRTTVAALLDRHKERQSD